MAEGLVIVASILLALAADAWWQARQDREVERDALRLILVDLVADTVETRQVVAIAARHAAAAGQLQSRWGDPESPAAPLDSPITAFLPWYHVQLQRSSYTGLRDGNGLALVENEALRVAIIRYFEHDQVRLLQLIDRAFTEREALFDLLWPHIMWGEAGAGTLSAVGFPTATLVSPWSDVVRDLRVFNQLASVRGTAAVTTRGAGGVLLANADLRRLIEQELSDF